ncbi:flagellar hook-length control protein FliK [Agrobacterium vitis]|nr:flagellar hook-length control protein FliK [Agrobacterium vitis]MBE1438266.1 flagellar hook-length control protein FliK [Agrobacterium vitis]
MDATIPAATGASISAAYTGTRTDQSQAGAGNFQSALADTSAGRDRGKSASADDQTRSSSASDKVDAASGKATGENDNTASVDDSAMADIDTEATDAGARTPSVTDVQSDTAAQVGDDTRSAKAASATLAKLVAALAQDGTVTTAPQSDTPVEDNGAVKVPTKDQTKVDDQALAQVGLEQIADNAAIVTDATKAAVKSPTKTKSETADADKEGDTPVSQKDASVGVQDALSLLVGQTATAGQASVTTSQTTVVTDATVKATAGNMLKDGLDAKAKSIDAGKIAETTQTATTQTAATTAQTTRNSAADALHMVSSNDHAAGSGVDDALTVADSATLVHQDTLQNVDVIDSRRIIAPVNTSNGANIAATMAGDGEWSSVMRSSSSGEITATDRVATDKTLNTLTIKMTPESLGTVTANLKLVDGQLSVSLVVENGSAYRKLHEDQGELLKSLKAQGLSVDQIQISIASPDKSTNDASQNNSQSQTSSQQQAQQNSSGQNHGGQRQQSQAAFDAYGQAAGGVVEDATSSGASGSGNSGSGAGGQLYL